MKTIETYIVIKRDRCKGGFVLKTRYSVGAKSEKEALKIAREKIGLGKISVYYKSSEQYRKYKEVTEDRFDLETGKWIFTIL